MILTSSISINHVYFLIDWCVHFQRGLQQRHLPWTVGIGIHLENGVYWNHQEERLFREVSWLRNQQFWLQSVQFQFVRYFPGNVYGNLRLWSGFAWSCEHIWVRFLEAACLLIFTTDSIPEAGQSPIFLLQVRLIENYWQFLFLDGLPRCVQQLQSLFTFHTDISSVPRMTEFRNKVNI